MRLVDNEGIPIIHPNGLDLAVRDMAQVARALNQPVPASDGGIPSGLGQRDGVIHQCFQLIQDNLADMFDEILDIRGTIGSCA